MPSHNDIEGVRIDNSVHHTGMKFGVSSQTLGGNFTIDADAPTIQVFDPTAARDITMPAEETSKGLMFIIVNAADAAEDMTIKNDAAGTIGTVSQNEIGIFVCDGTAWRMCVGKTT